MTWMRPSTAPRIPMVGENPPADSNTAGRLLFALLSGIEIYVHDLAQFCGLGAVDCEHQCLLKERIIDVS